MPSPRCPLCCATSTPVTGHMPAPEKAIRLSRIFLVLVIALALLFALTSNDIISYITKMISMIMSGMFICTMLGRFWTRFNWQGAVAAPWRRRGIGCGAGG